MAGCVDALNMPPNAGFRGEFRLMAETWKYPILGKETIQTRCSVSEY